MALSLLQVSATETSVTDRHLLVDFVVLHLLFALDVVSFSIGSMTHRDVVRSQGTPERDPTICRHMPAMPRSQGGILSFGLVSTRQAVILFV